MMEMTQFIVDLGMTLYMAEMETTPFVGYKALIHLMVEKEMIGILLMRIHTQKETSNYLVKLLVFTEIQHTITLLTSFRV